MISAEGEGWLEANQRYLSSTLNIIRYSLEEYIAKVSNPESCAEAKSKERNSSSELEQLATSMSEPPALDQLCAIFGLSPFERDILLLCAGMEFDSSFASLCAAAQGDKSKSYPTFSLALAALDNPHWSAIVPTSSLRYWRLIELVPGSTITLCPLRIDERILNYLAGVQHLDERLAGFVEPVYFKGDLVPSQSLLAEKIEKTWARSETEFKYTVINLTGRDAFTKRAVSSAACKMAGRSLWLMPAQFIPLSPDELGAFIRLWEREAALSGSVLLLECDDVDLSDKARHAAISKLVESLRSLLIVSSTERLSIKEIASLALQVDKPTSEEQRWLWEGHLGQLDENPEAIVDSLSSQFDLSAKAIQAACVQTLQPEQQCGVDDEDIESNIDYQKKSKEKLRRRLWDACRDQSRPRLEDLAQRIEVRARKDDLVLPEAQRKMLDDIAAHIRQRTLVYERWGFASKSQRGLGVSALFVGDSGTGKTMAAEVLAKELRLDLYRIDLSQVVSKYIGETEKNLKRVFDAAEDGGAILLFDEADALFGKRSEVKDSHDRYANIEISYLLQRMEAYRGLAILTTNMKDALDRSFLRRIRFVVDFQFPDAKQRAEIWRRIFPASTPVYGLDFNKLARLNLAGGNIRNIALYAAFLAADAEEGIGMNLLLRAARVEYAKLERPLTAAELGDWKWVDGE
jgi:SpoVK/Ycf46/Vps4 family AAA+-type ATPase